MARLAQRVVSVMSRRPWRWTFPPELVYPVVATTDTREVPGRITRELAGLGFVLPGTVLCRQGRCGQALVPPPAAATPTRPSREPGLHRVEVAGVQAHMSVADAEHRAAPDGVVGLCLQPAEQDRVLPVASDRRHGQLHELRRVVDVPSGQGGPEPTPDTAPCNARHAHPVARPAGVRTG